MADEPAELCKVHNRQSHCSACVLEAEVTKLKALLTEAADNIAYYDQFAKQELLPRIREALDKTE